MRILECRASVVVITLSLLLVAGCSDISGDPREQANDAITEANQTVSEHDRLFGEARKTYEGAREAIEAGKTPKDQTQRIAEARNKLAEARTSLEEARKPLSEVRDLDVEPEIKEYAGLVTEAMNAQLEAEAREIKFYEIVEADPILRDDRKKALDVLSEAKDGYGRAEASYAKSRKVADANPKLIGG